MLIPLLTLLHLFQPINPALIPPTPITKNYNLSNTSIPCQIHAYPAELRLMNSDYPTLDWNPGFYHMTSRNDHDAQIWATQVQFQSIITHSALNNSTLECKLELVLPQDSSSATANGNNPGLRIYGPNPIMNIYAVTRAPSSPAPFSSYVGAAGTRKPEAPVFSTINGDPEAVWRYWQNEDGIVKVGVVPCNETLTFQMGMQSAGVDWANFWAFEQVNAPAVPVQGWRIVHGC